MQTKWKRPESVLILIYRDNLDTLILERADFKNGWQSVTGSLEADETPEHAAWRELFEETGFASKDGQLHNWQQQQRFEIYPKWRHRYPPNTTHNLEHVFSFHLQRETPVKLAKHEHTAYKWCSAEEAILQVFSESNQHSLQQLYQKIL